MFGFKRYRRALEEQTRLRTLCAGLRHENTTLRTLLAQQQRIPRIDELNTAVSENVTENDKSVKKASSTVIAKPTPPQTVREVINTFSDVDLSAYFAGQTVGAFVNATFEEGEGTTPALSEFLDSLKAYTPAQVNAVKRAFPRLEQRFNQHWFASMVICAAVAGDWRTDRQLDIVTTCEDIASHYKIPRTMINVLLRHSPLVAFYKSPHKRIDGFKRLVDYLEMHNGQPASPVEDVMASMGLNTSAMHTMIHLLLLIDQRTNDSGQALSEEWRREI
jgi:hypothetical protein